MTLFSFLLAVSLFVHPFGANTNEYCLNYKQCANQTISTNSTAYNATVNCDGAKSCYNSNIVNFTVVHCDGDSACMGIRSIKPKENDEKAVMCRVWSM